MDGTLIEAWAARRSYERKPEPPRGAGGHGGASCCATPTSRGPIRRRDCTRGATAAEARPSYLGHVITENRNGLVVEAMVTESAQKAKRESGFAYAGQGTTTWSATLGADKAYQEEAFIARLREQNITPHVAEYAACKNWPNWLRPEERQHPLRPQSAEAEISGTGVWLDQSLGGDEANQVARPTASGLDVSAGVYGVQPGADAKFTGQPGVSDGKPLSGGSQRPPQSTKSWTPVAAENRSPGINSSRKAEFIRHDCKSRAPDANPWPLASDP